MEKEETSLYEMAKRFQANFFYLLDFEVQQADLLKIEQFEFFLKDRLADQAFLR